MKFRCPTCDHDLGGEWVYRDADDSVLEFGLRYDLADKRVYLAAKLSNERREEHAEIYSMSPSWLRELADWAEEKGVA